MAGEITFDEFTAALVFAAKTFDANIKGVAQQIAADLEAHAKAKFGVYQEGWAQLADATQEERLSKGYPANEPLLREGDLRDSVHTKVRKAGYGSAEIDLYSTSEIMMYQELGTATIPPRPVLMPTVLENAKTYSELTGVAAMASVLPARVRHNIEGEFASIAKKLRIKNA